MVVSRKTESKITNVFFDGDKVSVELSDGRTVSSPLSWYSRLQNALPEQRENWQLIAGGEGVHWPDVDEDLSLRGFLEGVKAPDGV